MSYFNTLQGYMGNLQEAQNHEQSMNQEQQDKKATGIQQKFEAISQQAEGWGGALTTGGLAWKQGLKVYKSAKGIVSGQTTPSSVKPTGAGETSTSEADLGAVPPPPRGVGGSSEADMRAGSIQGKARTQALEDRGMTADNDLASAGIKPALQDVQGFQSNTSDVIARVIAPRSAGDGAGGGAGGDAGNLASNAGATSRTVANTGNDLSSMGEDLASSASRTIASTVGAGVKVGAEIGEKVATTAMDAIPVIGEVVGIGTMIGGLIHGLHKGGLADKMAQAQDNASSTARGAIDTGALKGAQTIQGQIRA